MREVTVEEGQRFARANEAYFMETSALDNTDGAIEKAFGIMTQEILKRSDRSEISGDITIKTSTKYGGGGGGGGYTNDDGYSTRLRSNNNEQEKSGGCSC